eukprot:CAMPEP_0183732518 /NCGR_PEP_ID=MMETSP0737-20130205/38650_1 /TAXON_ID=385413 /ORGANISM="Thalassiosira miniscula, Strain CCMP1093" /LENGTH=347 /DNA_ID=CAMNT_0025965547 /DNA_START=54 /DNA_END=1097 /DNA_ORIENTATION=+
MAVPGSMASFLLSKRIAQPLVTLRCVTIMSLPTMKSQQEQKIRFALGKDFRSRCQGNRASSDGSSALSKRSFSNRSSFEAEYEGLLAQRNKNIIMHPEGHGQKILPGNFVVKKHPKTGAEKKVLLEHALGYFWALKELSLTDKKPILSNETLIAAAEAEKFPVLKDLVNLQDEEVDIPDFFTRNNRSKDANVQCTLVAISLKEFGAQLLPSWTEPFDKALRYGKDADRFEVVRITINEGRIAKLLSPFIVSGTKKNVPEKDHSNTLLYYGDAEEWRDILRMHNIYTGYVFLVDGIGRVRWAGSGEGSDEEVQSMIMFARELTRSPERAAHKKQVPGPRVGKRVPRGE